MIQLRLHVVPLADAEVDANGNHTHPSAITPQEFSDLIARVNWSFEGTGLQIVFDPRTDWVPMNDTMLNRDGPNMRQRGNSIATSMPGKIVCFLRWGNGNLPTGNGNAFPPPGAGPKPPSVPDIQQDYVALPNQIAPNFGLLNQGNGSFVAHELGHYLGLYHTFPGWTDLDGPVYGGSAPSQQAADQSVVNYIAANGGTINALDGDGLSDTPPDPSPVLYRAHGQDICVQRQIQATGLMNGQTVSFNFAPDSNVMGYHPTCGPGGLPPPPAKFSPQQVERMHQALQHPSRSQLVRIVSSGIANEREVWATLGEQTVGRPTRRLGILTGTAVFDFTGQGSDWLRDALELLVGPRFPNGTRVEQLSATGALASIANDGTAVNAGWAVDEVDAAFDTTNSRIKLIARLAVRDVDGYVQRLSYKANAIVLLPAVDIEPIPLPTQ